MPTSGTMRTCKSRRYCETQDPPWSPIGFSLRSPSDMIHVLGFKAKWGKYEAGAQDGSGDRSFDRRRFDGRGDRDKRVDLRELPEVPEDHRIDQERRLRRLVRWLQFILQLLHRSELHLDKP